MSDSASSALPALLKEMDLVTFQQQWHATTRRPDCSVCATADPAPGTPERLDVTRG